MTIYLKQLIVLNGAQPPYYCVLLFSHRVQKVDDSLELQAFVIDHFNDRGAIIVVIKAISIRAENWLSVSKGAEITFEDMSSELSFKITEATTISTAPRPFIPKPTIMDSQ